MSNFIYREKGFRKKLANGIMMKYIRCDDRGKMHNRINICYTSAGSSIGKNCVAHLLEHCVLKKPDGTDIDVDFRNHLFFNAYTTYSATSYYLTTTDRFQKDNFHIQEDLLHNVTVLVNNLVYGEITQETFNTERDIVRNEIYTNVYASEFASVHAMELLYDIKLHGRDLKEFMDDITLEDVLEYREKRYVSENMVVCIVGNCTQDTLDAIESLLEKIPATKGCTKIFERKIGVKPEYEIPFPEYVVNNEELNYGIALFENTKEMKCTKEFLTKAHFLKSVIDDFRYDIMRNIRDMGFYRLEIFIHDDVLNFNNYNNSISFQLYDQNLDMIKQGMDYISGIKEALKEILSDEEVFIQLRNSFENDRIYYHDDILYSDGGITDSKDTNFTDFGYVDEIVRNLTREEIIEFIDSLVLTVKVVFPFK